ncbi:hypothetical protein GJA_5398 [Janthinobacterium agaricidamnosum NBRC 102515 = DSM 9628]|uniref:Uncharacterized protein n=1 Tax=Janthinobacterium agaricidamnosum NBRC 102515 = DSM 9628 TaxID=1349767 RepID=W0VB22_9BURK|nr:hypothetical protein GJA_5398 [Janthinobacterium agaricidamnosum NBRC 102515 = DSM 9628]
MIPTNPELSLMYNHLISPHQMLKLLKNKHLIWKLQKLNVIY